MIVELYGLEVYGYHGAYEEEQRNGQLFLFDVQLDVEERGADDDLATAIDYTHVAARIRALKRLKLRVRKQPAGLGVEHSAAIVTRP